MQGNVISLNGNNGINFSSLSGPGKRIVTANASGQLMQSLFLFLQIQQQQREV
jgi:hypothetical protein